MLDLKWIRENPEAFDAAMARRGLPPQSGALLSLDADKRKIQTDMQEVQARRNAVAKEIGKAKASGGDADALIREVADLKGAAQELEARERDLQAELDTALSVLPNILDTDVPDGESEAENVELRRVGDIPAFDFKPKEHYELGDALGLMDFETAAKISGSCSMCIRRRRAISKSPRR